MKISKIFHWLYFSLLVLPLLIFLPTGLYYAFNEHADNGTQTATATAEVEYQYKYQSNEVNNLNDLVVGNLYYLESEDINLYYDQEDFSILKINLYSCDFSDDSAPAFRINPSFNNLNDDDVYMEVDFSNNSISFILNDFEYGATTDDFDLYFNSFVFSIIDGLNEFKTWCTNNNYLPQYTNFNVIESATATATIEYNNDNSIVNAMSSAWDDVWSLPLFSWTSSSFILTPTSYLSGFFGIAANSSINLALTYWLSISIVWLMFDVMMYVPLLIHHYLDKAEVS